MPERGSDPKSSSKRSGDEAWLARRAQRFALHLPLLYRQACEGEWRQGSTENLSLSGVLFRGTHRLEPDSPIELALHIPFEVSGGALLHLTCKGFVVRVEPVKDPHACSIGAAILDYQLSYAKHRLAGRQRAWPRQAPMTHSSRHGLNNLIEIMLGYSELLLDRTDLDATVRTHLMHIRTAARDAAELVRTQTEPKKSK